MFVASLCHEMSCLHFYRPFSRWTWVSQYQNVSILDFIGAKGDGGGDNCQIDTTNIQHFTGWMPFLSPNQQRLSTEGICRGVYITNSILVETGYYRVAFHRENTNFDFFEIVNFNFA